MNYVTMLKCLANGSYFPEHGREIHRWVSNLDSTLINFILKENVDLKIMGRFLKTFLFLLLTRNESEIIFNLKYNWMDNKDKEKKMSSKRYKIWLKRTQQSIL